MSTKTVKRVISNYWINEFKPGSSVKSWTNLGNSQERGKRLSQTKAIFENFLGEKEVRLVEYNATMNEVEYEDPKTKQKKTKWVETSSEGPYRRNTIRYEPSVSV